MFKDGDSAKEHKHDTGEKTPWNKHEQQFKLRTTERQWAAGVNGHTCSDSPDP